MASIWTANHAAGDFLEWDGTVFTEPEIDANSAQSDTYGWRTDRGSTKELKLEDWLGGAADDNIYLQFYFRIITAPSANEIPIIYIQAVGGATSSARIRVNTDRTLELWSGSAQIGSDSSALSLNTWYRIELHIDTTPADGSHVLEALLDGVSFAKSTTQTLDTIGRLIAGYDNNATTKDFDFDTFELDDSEWVTGITSSSVKDIIQPGIIPFAR